MGEVRTPESIIIRLDWSEASSASLHHVNQAIGSLGPPTRGIPDGVYLMLGEVEPSIVQDDEGREQAIRELKSAGAKVRVPGRYHFSRELAGEIIRVLREVTAQYDAAVNAARAEAGEEA